MRLALLGSLGVGFGACAKSQQGAPPRPALEALPRDHRGVVPAAEAEVGSSRPATEIVELSGAALGPRLVATSRGRLVVWAKLDGDAPAYFSRLVPESGAPLRVNRLAPIEPASRLLQLGATKGGGVIASTVRRIGSRDALDAMVLGPEGELRAGPYLVAETPAEILFTGVVPSARGALLFWVEKVGKQASLWVSHLPEKGPTRPLRLVEDVSAWQIARSTTGTTVVTREGKSSFAIVLRQLGDTGAILGSPVTLANHVSGGLDLDMATTSERIVVAWSEPHEAGARVMAAATDKSGNPISVPAVVAPSRGSQALVRLLGSAQEDVFTVVWEEPRLFAHGLASLVVGRSAKGASTVRESAAFAASRRDPLLPVLTEDEGRLVVLTDRTACPPLGDEGCTERGDAPFVIHFDETLGGFQAHPLHSTDEPAARLAWDLACGDDGCRALTASGSPTTTVYLTSDLLSSHTSSRVTHGATIFDSSAPRIRRFEALEPVPELSGLSAVRVGEEDSGHELLTWLSYFDPDQPYVIPSTPAPDGRRAPVRALLSTVAVSPLGDSARSESRVLSYRARSLGHVSLVSPEAGTGLVAWAAVDGKDPQLFATLVNERGEKARQKMLTRTPGEVSDVAAVRVADGYMIAWVDGRDGVPEVYALHVDRNLEARGQPVQVSHGARAPADVALLGFESGVFVVWSDARGATEAGRADLYAAVLDPVDGALRVAERKLVESDGHAHAPHLAPAPGPARAQLVWVDSSPGQSTGTGRARATSIDVQSLEAGPITDLPTPRGVSDVSLDCSNGTCRALVLTSNPNGSPSLQQLWAVHLLDVPRASFLLPLESDVPDAVVPVLIGDVAYFSDRVPNEDRYRLMRLEIDWSGGEP